jgi:hypothetical protein
VCNGKGVVEGESITKDAVDISEEAVLALAHHCVVAACTQPVRTSPDAVTLRNADVMLRALAADRDRIAAAIKCDVCLGQPINDKPCICGGSGLLAHAVINLRQELLKAEDNGDRLARELGEAQKSADMWEREYRIEHGRYEQTCGQHLEAKKRAESAEQQLTAMRLQVEAKDVALRTLLPMVEEWHQEFPDHIGDKEALAISEAKAALTPRSPASEAAALDNLPNGKLP